MAEKTSFMFVKYPLGIVSKTAPTTAYDQAKEAFLNFDKFVQNKSAVRI